MIREMMWKKKNKQVMINTLLTLTFAGSAIVINFIAFYNSFFY